MGFDEKSLAEQQGTPPAAGDATAKFLGGVFETDVTDTSQVMAFNKGAHDLKALASDGGFAINEAGMTEYIKLCDMFLDGYSSRQRELMRLTERAKLGSSPYAYKVADHNITVANGDRHSLIPNLDLMKDGYERLKEAFEIARKNYRETEAEHDKVFKKILPG
ncbi:hypothetical protein [Amycolatopsis sp.]|uniref:hypothetical protein n=1 Tax=Amycolatopsis sp. TaxID=37632 RepID=UPI002DFAD4CF|nr:hypothetical protein [Amycolatopsis sp.]